jgi:hypothetical protein
MWGCMPVRIFNEGHCNRVGGATSPTPLIVGEPQRANQQCGETHVYSLKSTQGGAPEELGAGPKR